LFLFLRKSFAQQVSLDFFFFFLFLAFKWLRNRREGSKRKEKGKERRKESGRERERMRGKEKKEGERRQ
jgi:nicotinamide riboside transporter PnuC